MTTRTNEPARGEPLRVLFVMPSLRSLRYFQSTLELLVERGHKVHLRLEERRGASERQWLARMARADNFTFDIVKAIKREPWQLRRQSVQAGMEYLHFLAPSFQGRTRYMTRAMRRSPSPVLRRLTELPLIRTARGLRCLYATLAVVDRGLPASALAAQHLRKRRPDVVVLGVRGSRSLTSSNYAEAARKLGIPSLHCVASWDNLTTRPRMRELPQRLVVWNETQLQEAVQLHGVPAERVVVTGAPSFDQWFTWRPRARDDFLARIGLDPARPVVLWVGSALNQWEPREVSLVRRWLEALRSSSDRSLRETGVLLRPHPLRDEWPEQHFQDFENVAIWPRREMSMPVDHEQKADYYDSIFHSCAVVGINTSAMIEASIVGRPILTFLDDDYHDSQFGALHFTYLLESEGGVLRVAKSLEEHLADLRGQLSGRDGDGAEAATRFVARFVRPRGLDQPVTPILADTIEQVARTEVVPERDPVWATGIRALLDAPRLVRPFLADATAMARRGASRSRRSLGAGRAALTKVAGARRGRGFPGT